jgi:tRNA-modifying protein YgfZ
MTTDWTEFLRARGAILDADGVRHFGDPAAELAAAAKGDVVADLSHLGLLGVTGEDAQAFLQAQLSCDISALGDQAAGLGAYCSPKGRMLANFLVWPEGGGYFLALSRSIVGSTAKRLGMFVLRSKVVLADRTGERYLLGAAGPAAERTLLAALGTVPASPQGVSRSDGATVIRLAPTRFLVAVVPACAESLWTALAGALRPVGTPCWEWLDVAAGIPRVTARTQDEFVPQMANLELLGGVSFQKGCYPGQEVVARTQFLGKAKRRMFLARIEGADPQPGDPLYSEDLGDQASGMIVNAAPAPDGGIDVLAVVHAPSAAAGTVHLGSLTGAPLRFRPLPYAVP